MVHDIFYTQTIFKYFFAAHCLFQKYRILKKLSARLENVKLPSQTKIFWYTSPFKEKYIWTRDKHFILNNSLMKLKSSLLSVNPAGKITLVKLWILTLEITFKTLNRRWKKGTRVNIFDPKFRINFWPRIWVNFDIWNGQNYFRGSCNHPSLQVLY